MTRSIASAADIKARRYAPTPDDPSRVVAWIDQCEVSWIARGSPTAAHDLERDMTAERLPPLYVRSDMTIMPWNGIAFKGGQNLLAQVLLQQLVAGTGYVVVYPHPGSAPVARWPLADARR